MSLKSSFIQYLLKKYPDLTSGLATEQLENLVSDQLLSPFQVKLSKYLLSDIQQEINSYWSLRDWGSKNISEKFSSQNLRIPKNFSACMSYDFHVNSDQKLELIEINTNASFLALGLEMYDFHKIKNAVPFTDQNLIDMFLNELKLCGIHQPTPKIAITDSKPSEQRLYVEFLVYQQIFKKYGIQSDILDIENVTENSDFLYNRYTDFYLQSEPSKKIKELYNSEKINLSPQPWDYFLLADKQRLIDWNEQIDQPKPESLLPVYDLGKADKDRIWKERKNLFFKPKNSFGSKQAYKGASISKTTFENVFSDQFIAQKISNPSEIEVTFEDKPIKYKYDLRCYAYQDQLQMIIARIYQGQTTNLRTPGGGFACVIVD